MKHDGNEPNNHTRTPKRIGLLDHMGFGNMGDAAIQESFIENIQKRIPNVTLIGFSLYPEDTRKRHNIDCYPITWSHPGRTQINATTSPARSLRTVIGAVKKLKAIYALAKPLHDAIQEAVFLVRSYRILTSLDILVMSGGGQLCELYGSLPYNVYKFCLLGKLARTPVLMVGIGADLLKRPINKRFAKWAVHLANYTSFRSIESQNLMVALGIRRETHVCPDPAYGLDIRQYLNSARSDALTVDHADRLARSLLDSQSLTSGVNMPSNTTGESVISERSGVLASLEAKPKRDAESYPCGERTTSPHTAGPKVGINPIGFCDPRRWPRKNSNIYWGYLEKLAVFSAWLLERGYDIEIFTSDFSGDVHAIEDLKELIVRRTPQAAASAVVVRPVLTLKELLLQMSTFTFIVTSRFHGMIFSHLLAKPVLALSYLPKMNHLSESVGHERYCLDLTHFDAQTLIHRFQSMVDEKEWLSRLFTEKTAGNAKALEKEFDHLFLDKACIRPARRTFPEMMAPSGTTVPAVPGPRCKV